MAAAKKEGFVESQRLITTSRTVQVSLAVLNLSVGVVLALFMRRYLADLPILLARKWYDFYLLPLLVASLFCVVEAVWVRLPAGWIYGLLLTGPPYGWHAGLATALYLDSRGDVLLSEYVRVALPAFLLALAGAIINVIVTRLVEHLKTKRGTTSGTSSTTPLGA